MNYESCLKVSISILTYNRKQLLRRLILSLQELLYAYLEIIVVDNHSNDGTREMMLGEFSNVKYIRTRKNLGAGARNFGIKKATGDIIITLDDDIIGIDNIDVTSLISSFASRPRLGALNFKILYYDSDKICNWVHHCIVEEFTDKEFLTYEITEGAVAFRKTAIEEVGYYSDMFFLSHEGPDLAFRLLNRGWNVIYSPIIAVRHHHSDIAREPWLNYYYDTRNLFWVAARNFPYSYGMIYLLRGMSSMFVYSIRDGYFKYWIKGVMDGLIGLRNAMKDRHILNRELMEKIREIDSKRPSLSYLIHQRVFRKGARL